MPISKRVVRRFFLPACLLAIMALPGAGFSQDAVGGSADSGKITLDIKGMDILDVLKILSMKSGLNIVAGKNVTGRVTIYLKEVNVNDALNIILIANNLAYEKKDDIINVMTDRDYELIYGERFYDKKQLEIIKLTHAKAPQISAALSQIKTNVGKIVVDEASNTLVVMDVPSRIEQMKQVAGYMDHPVKTRVFSLKYASAEEMQKQVSEMITKNLGELKVDARTNSVVVTDLPDRLAGIERLIKAFDKINTQVLIEAKILEISLSDRQQYGVDWDVVAKKYLGIHQNLKLTLTQGGSIKIGALAGGEEADEQGEYSALIEALRSQGEVNTLSAPKITALNNQESKILVGTKEPYATKTVVSTEATATTAEQITFVDVGVKLYVTPTINDDGFVTMKIRPEVSSTGTPYVTSEGNKVPVVSTTEAETTVMVKDGSTIVIAGLIKDKQDVSSKKIPILGDIPLLGSAFRSHDDTKTKQEIIILLTPHIVSGDATFEDVSRVRKKIDLIPKVKGKLERQEEIRARRTVRPAVIEPYDILDSPVTEEKRTDTPAEKKTYEKYYAKVKKAVIDSIRDNFSGIEAKGECKLFFVLGSSGRIVSGPVIIKEDNKLTGDMAIESVKLAAPFEPFPAGLLSEQEKFSFTLTFK